MNAWTLSAIAGAALLVAIANRRVELLGTIGDDVALPDDVTGPGLEQGQGGGVLESTLASLDPSTYLPAMTDVDTASSNEQAFLQAIRKAEGTDGDRGYQTLFGYRYFDDYSDHPRSPAQFTDSQGVRKWTSAAGAYQIMAISPLPGGGSTKVDTWDKISAKLGLVDFTPASQDAAALGLIDEKGALNDVRAGRFDTAIAKVRKVWASLPGAGYGQPERDLATLRTAYLNAGGQLA